MNLNVPYALFKNTNKLIHISDTKIKDLYVCPSCGDNLIFKNGNVRVKHFAHKGNVGCSVESNIHAAAKQIILNNSSISLGKTITAYNSPKLEFIILNRRPDVVVQTDNGELLIEIGCTNFMTNQKIADLNTHNLLEIDLSEVKYDTSIKMLREIVLFTARRKFYKHHLVANHVMTKDENITQEILKMTVFFASAWLLINNIFKRK